MARFRTGQGGRRHPATGRLARAGQRPNNSDHRSLRWGDTARLAAGLRRDFDAAKAGLTLRHSSGKVEGHVNRIKMLKRQMYGRANPGLLRKRILLAD